MKGRRLQVLLEVEKGPATSRDVSDATGIPFPNVAAVMSQLHASGILARKELPRIGKGKREAVYRIASNDPAQAAGGQS